METDQAQRNRLLAAMILVPVIPCLASLLVGYRLITTSLRESASGSMARIVEDHRGLIEIFLAERRKDLELLADSRGFGRLSDPGELAVAFGLLRARSPAFADLGVFDANGLHLAYVGPYALAGRDYGDAEWFRRAREKGWYLSDVFLGFRNVPHFVVAVAREGESGPWLLRATIDTPYFTELVEAVRIGRTGEAYVLGQNGRFQTGRRSGGRLLESDPDAAALLARPDGPSTFSRTDARGERHLYATAPLLDGQWLLVARQEESDAFATRDDVVRAVFLISAVGVVLILVVAFTTTGRIVGRMRRSEAERGALNQQLIVAGRLAEIGEMAAGIAHEINNPLQIIRTEHALVHSILDGFGARGVLPNGEDTADLLDSVNQIAVQTDRCGKITGSLLDFARRREPEVRTTDLADFVPEVVDMVANRAAANGVALRREVDAAAPLVAADTGQLQQVVLNLLNNALDAVGSRHGADGGVVTVRLRGEDGRAVIEVADNGPGIPADLVPKVFTPFFTTKPAGRGTGLGLSVCYGIVAGMGGRIELATRVGEGTTFTVRLPAAKETR